MNEPWFDANLWGWLPGTAIGMAGGIWGSLVGVFASRGQGKALVWLSYWFMLAIGASLLVAAGLAYANEQPWPISYSLALPGVIVLLVLVPLGFVAARVYRQAEERKMRAAEFE